MTTNWNEELKAWNNVRNMPRFRRITGCDQNPEFETVKEMLEWLYKKTGSLGKVGSIFGMSNWPVQAEMKKNGSRINIGHHKRKSVLEGANIEGRTAREVAEECGVSTSCVRSYAMKHGIRLKKVARGHDENKNR